MEIRILLITTALILAIAFSFLLLLVFARLQGKINSKHEDETKIKFLSLLRACLDIQADIAGFQDFKSFRREELPAAAFLFLYYDELIAGDSRELIRKFAFSLGLDGYAREVLDRHKTVKELQLGIAVAGRLRLYDCRENVLVYSQDKDPTLSLNAAKAGLEIQPETLGNFITNVILRADWSISRCEMILRKIDHHQLYSELQVIVDSGKFNDSVRLIFICRLVQNNITLLKPFLSDHQPESIIAAAIRSLNGVESMGVIRKLANHESWVIRCQVARYLRRYALYQDISLLVRLLNDNHWWVKFRAAEALVLLPNIDITELVIKAKLNAQAQKLLDAVRMTMPGAG